MQLFEEFSDDNGNISSRPVFRNGHPVLCREAVDRRDRLLEHLASLPPVPAALDQILHRFGTDQVAEVTGRSRRIVRKAGGNGIDRLAVENRAGSANISGAGLPGRRQASNRTNQAQGPGITRTDLVQNDLSIPGREVVQVLVEIAPRVVAPKHTHPGDEIAYVVEGSLVYA